MNPDALFIQTLEDLHRSLVSADEYEVLRASHLMRQLLLDGGNSLVNRVNRQRRLKLDFLAIHVVPPGIGPSEPWFAAYSILPLGIPGAAPVAFCWDRFQKLVVARCGGHEFTVHDIIDYAAHVAGGVHMGEPRHDSHRVLAGLQAGGGGLGLGPVAAMVRAIGRVILDGLEELKGLVLGVGRFEGGPGLSVYANVALGRMAGGEENYIFDIGSDPARNRLTVFLDAHAEFCVRMFDSCGKVHQLRAGPAGGAFHYGEPLWLVCEVGCQSGEVLVNVDSPGCSLARVFQGADAPSFDHPVPLVMGSDVTGRCRSRMLSFETIAFQRLLPRKDKENCAVYLAGRLADGCTHAIEFWPGAMMHSALHPNFSLPDGYTGSGADLVAPSNERRPRLRLAPFHGLLV